MKSVVLVTGAFALSAGLASAEVTLSGDARMGIISSFDLALADDPLTAGVDESLIDESDLQFTSRARVKFTLSGSTDNGLEFGASFRAQDAVNASKGTAGSVFISGAFGKLSMGDVDGAANAAIGQVSGVGLTGLGDLNEISYTGNGGSGLAPVIPKTADPSVLFEYSTGDLTVYASVTQLSFADADAYSVAAKYAFGNYTIALGYENFSVGVLGEINSAVIGATATFGPATVKAIYGKISVNPGIFDEAQWALSADYKIDALTLTAFYANDEKLIDAKAYGVGASYDLGGGASVVGGYSHNDTSNADAYDLGISMAF